MSDKIKTLSKSIFCTLISAMGAQFTAGQGQRGLRRPAGSGAPVHIFAHECASTDWPGWRFSLS
jgi:hypothetical protein